MHTPQPPARTGSTEQPPGSQGPHLAKFSGVHKHIAPLLPATWHSQLLPRLKVQPTLRYRQRDRQYTQAQPGNDDTRKLRQQLMWQPVCHSQLMLGMQQQAAAHGSGRQAARRTATSVFFNTSLTSEPT